MEFENEFKNNLGEKSSKEKFYKIGEIASYLGVHIQTLRIYDREGLLCPKRTDTNRRGYSEDDIGRAKVILYLTRSLGVNLNGVKIILKFLEKSRLKPALALELLSDVAKQAGIGDTEIENNLKRFDKD